MKSKEFNQFAIWNFNRQRQHSHVQRIKESIKVNGYRDELKIYVTPLMNEVIEGKYVIIDGQHRFLACQELSTEFHFEIIHSAVCRKEIEDLIILYNIERENLDYKDYAYMNRENPNYSKLLELQEKTGFSIKTMIVTIYSWRINGLNKVGHTKVFAEGNFILPEYVINKILKVYSVNLIFQKTKMINYKGGKNTYIKSISSILSNPLINLERLIKSIEKYPDRIENRDQLSNTLNLYRIYNLHQSEKVDIPANLNRK